jgi:hypothetical protein
MIELYNLTKLNNMYIVRYNSNINLPFWCNHKGNPNEMLGTDSKHFFKRDLAIKFLKECTMPITKLSELRDNNTGLPTWWEEVYDIFSYEEEELLQLLTT